jgi:FkbM family methyltransferase
MQKSKLRKAVASILPRSLRSFLGRWWMWGYERTIRPVLGLIFDLQGGRFRVDGCEIEVPKHLTTRTYRGCFMMGDYEAEERALIKRYLRPDDAVIELGACIGAVSCTTNRLLADKSKHVVIEGNPKLIPTLERNKEINGCGFAVLNKVVSDQEFMEFFIHDTYIVGGSVLRESGQKVMIPGVTFAGLQRDHGPFNVLIMDIEGGEVQVIPPAVEFLKTCRLVVWETHDWACGKDGTDKCRAALAEAGLVHVATEDATEAWLRQD